MRMLMIAMLQGWTALHCAAYKGHIESALLLLQHGADLTAQTAVVSINWPHCFLCMSIYVSIAHAINQDHAAHVLVML